ncbi:glutamate receptor ionotropic, kainate 2-like [Patella vulgata]|uniref:glutamate receptor ionotropic, kainate 2-like n=1 Tax=Patella vulgata TaxID=6465 RepID=UPI0024A97EE0|nr:glutamate receptor ionotropic, kainate 2-like [Patella vulgata]
MDFTFPYYFGYSVVFFRKPDPNADKWYTLLAPFTWQVLLCIFCAVIFVGFLLYGIERFNPFYEKMYPKRKHVGLQSTMWYLYGALLSHGGNAMPEAAAGRLVISTWWLFCMICAATYSGNLIAFLTVTTKEVPFSTLAEMVANDEYTWGYLQGSFLETLFKNSNLPTYQNVWEGIKRFSENNPNHLHPSIDAHFDRMMSSKYAVIDDGSSIFSWSEHQCDIEILNERFFPNHYALGLPNHSPFTNLISNQMIKIYESGLLQVWQQNWWPKTKFCKGSLTAETEAIDLLSLQSAFYVLCIGLFLAFVTLGIEFVRRCIMKNQKPTHLGEGEKQH